MELYNYHDLIADINEFEKLESVIFFEGMQNIQFFKLYSEVVKTPLTGENTAIDLKTRIGSFLNKIDNLVPFTDVAPDFSIEYNVYAFVFVPEGPAELFKTRAKLLCKTADEAEAVAMVWRQEHPFYIVVNTLDKQTYYYNVTVG